MKRIFEILTKPVFLLIILCFLIIVKYLTCWYLCFEDREDTFGWQFLFMGGTILGIVTDFAILIYIYNYFSRITIRIKGLGEIRVRRTEYNIQSLTNIISKEFYNGGNFNRDLLLNAFYNNDNKDYEIIKESDTNYTPSNVIEITLKDNNQKIKLERSFIKINIHNKINDLNNLLHDLEKTYTLGSNAKKELFQGYYEYNLEQPTNVDGSKVIFISYENQILTVNRDLINSISELNDLVKIAWDISSDLSEDLKSQIIKQFYNIS